MIRAAVDGWFSPPQQVIESMGNHHEKWRFQEDEKGKIMTLWSFFSGKVNEVVDFASHVWRRVKPGAENDFHHISIIFPSYSHHIPRFFLVNPQFFIPIWVQASPGPT
jgi:hypothetical protein